MIAVLVIAFLSGVLVGRTMTNSAEQPSIQVCFSPEGKCSTVVISWIEQAKKSVHILMFTFTFQPLADALIEAKNRGVEIMVVLERTQEINDPIRNQLLNAGIQVRLDSNDATMHDKIAIIDSTIILTGSFNWTSSANSANDENLVVMSDSELAELFERQFLLVWNVSS